MSNPLPDESVKQISAAVFAGQIIKAIQLYRQATSSSLLDAKNFIEALQVRLWQESPEMFTAPPGKAGCFKATAILAFFAITIYFVARFA